MNSTKTLSIAIDPSGTETGGRVVKRVIDEVAASATKAEKSVDSLASKSGKAMHDVGDSAQHAGKEMKTFGASAQQTEQAMQAALRATSSTNQVFTQFARGSSLASFQQRNLAFQLNDVTQSIMLGMPAMQILMQQGPQIAQIYGPGEGGIGRAFKETAIMATALVARLWPLAAAAAGVYGAYKLISSFSVAARTDVDDLTRSMAEQAMSAGSLKGAVSELATMRASLVDASGISGALGGLINLQGSYSAAIGNTGNIQTQVSSTVVDNLRREFNAKRAVLEIESRLQAAKLATMRADIAAKRVSIEAEIGKSVFTRGDLVAQGFEDPRVGRLTQLPDSVSGLDKLRSTLDRLEGTPEFLAFKKMGADLAVAEVAAEQLAAALNTGFGDVALKSGMDSLSKLSATAFGPAIQGANSFSTAIGGITAATQTASSGVINVTEAMAAARRQTLAAMQQSSAQLTSMKTELSDIQATLANAAKIPADSIFGKNLTGQAASDAIANAATSIQKVMTALDQGGMAARTAHEAIEMVRASLIQMGGDTKAVNLLIDRLVAGHMRAMDLKGAVDQLSQSILNIPNKMVSIGIQQYTVPASGGGKTGINVYGGGADFSQTQYNVGGKNIGVYGGNGSYGTTKGYYYDSPYDLGIINEMYGGARAKGGPVQGGKQYLVGEEGPELVTMGGSGSVATANSTASILSGGRDTLSLMEDHLYSIMNELKAQTAYMATAESDTQTVIGCLNAIKSVAASSASYSGGSSSSGSSGRFASNDNAYGNQPTNFHSLYADINQSRRPPGTEGPGFMPYNIVVSRPYGQSGSRDLYDGFATGGQIMPGEDQKVEFFKKNTERVIIVDDSKVSDSRGSPAKEKATVHAPMTFHFHGDTGDNRSRQAVMDDVRRTVIQVMQGR